MSKISKKQILKNKVEFFYLPKHNPIGDYAEWIRVPEGLLLKKVEINNEKFN